MSNASHLDDERDESLQMWFTTQTAAWAQVRWDARGQGTELPAQQICKLLWHKGIKI